MDQFLRIGFIKKPHGIKGELKVLPLTDDHKRFKKVKKVFCGFTQDKVNSYDVKSVKIQPSEIVIKLDGCETRNESENLRNNYIFIYRSDGVDLDNWEYYTQDLIDCEIVFDNKSVGLIVDVVNHGTVDLFVVKFKNEEIFYPFLKEYIDNIDIEKKKIFINQFEGFFD